MQPPESNTEREPRDTIMIRGRLHPNPAIFGDSWLPMDARHIGICTTAYEHQKKLFRMFHDPVRNPRKILEVGTRVPCWAEDIANKYPDSQVTGFYTCPIRQSSQHNCHLISIAWNTALSLGQNEYDLIVSQMLLGTVDDWVWHTRMIFRALKPGGYYRCREHRYVFTDADGEVLPEKHPWSLFNTYFRMHAKHPLDFTSETVDSLGFYVTHKQTAKVPVRTVFDLIAEKISCFFGLEDNIEEWLYHSSDYVFVKYFEMTALKPVESHGNDEYFLPSSPAICLGGPVNTQEDELPDRTGTDLGEDSDSEDFDPGEDSDSEDSDDDDASFEYASVSSDDTVYEDL